MSWLNQILPIVLHQGSEIPYVILEDGVHLCFENLFYEEAYKSERNITFKISRKLIKRQSTKTYKLTEFPIVVPFSSIVALDDTVVEGRIIKHATTKIDETKEVIVIRDRFLRRIDDNELDSIVDVLENSDAGFLLIGKNIDPQARLLDGLVEPILHDSKDWGRTCVTIADRLCPTSHRKYCWTKSVPDCNIHFYGLTESDDMDVIQNCLDFAGLTNFEAHWES